MKRHYAMALCAASAVLAFSHGSATARTRHAASHHHAPSPLVREARGHARRVFHHGPSLMQEARAEAQAHRYDTAWTGESGTASYYSSKYNGRRTSSGARFDQREYTAAHAWLPFGTKIKVYCQDTGRSVVVTVTDRIYSQRRIVDLSHSAAEDLGIVHRGLAKVSLTPT
jgi:rare lipoprotein A